MYEFSLNDYLSEYDNEEFFSLLPIPTLTTDKYKMGWQTHHEVEVNVEVKSVATYDNSTINKKQYSPPLYPQQLFN